MCVGIKERSWISHGSDTRSEFQGREKSMNTGYHQNISNPRSRSMLGKSTFPPEYSIMWKGGPGLSRLYLFESNYFFID